MFHEIIPAFAEHGVRGKGIERDNGKYDESIMSYHKMLKFPLHFKLFTFVRANSKCVIQFKIKAKETTNGCKYKCKGYGFKVIHPFTRDKVPDRLSRSK